MLVEVSKFRDLSNYTPMNGRIDPECNLICENRRRSAETNAFRRNDFAFLMTVLPHSKRQNQFSTAKAGAMKNRRTRFARDIFLYMCTCTKIHITIAFLPRECGGSARACPRIARMYGEMYARGASYTREYRLA